MLFARSVACNLIRVTCHFEHIFIPNEYKFNCIGVISAPRWRKDFLSCSMFPKVWELSCGFLLRKISRIIYLLLFLLLLFTRIAICNLIHVVFSHFNCVCRYQTYLYHACTNLTAFEKCYAFRSLGPCVLLSCSIFPGVWRTLFTVSLKKFISNVVIVQCLLFTPVSLYMQFVTLQMCF